LLADDEKKEDSSVEKKAQKRASPIQCVTPKSERLHYSFSFVNIVSFPFVNIVSKALSIDI